MLDGAFFAKKSHPVAPPWSNALADAGRSWSPAMGNDDPLYRKIDAIVRRILDADSPTISRSSTGSPPTSTRFLAEEESRRGEHHSSPRRSPSATAPRSPPTSRAARSSSASRARRCRVPGRVPARTLARRHGPKVYATDGDDSEAWGASVATLEDLVWSVQPNTGGPRHLVALPPNRCSSGCRRGGAAVVVAAAGARGFMSNLVEAHAAAVKPHFAQVDSPTAAMAVAAGPRPKWPKTAGDEKAAQQAEALAGRWRQPSQRRRCRTRVLDDRYLEDRPASAVASGSGDSGPTTASSRFAKLAWIGRCAGPTCSPTSRAEGAVDDRRGTGRAFPRRSRPRRSKAEPLLDRALTVMGKRDRLPAIAP